MGKHEKTPEEVAADIRKSWNEDGVAPARKQGGKHKRDMHKEARLSDLISGLRQLGDDLGIKVEPHFVRLSDLLNETEEEVSVTADGCKHVRSKRFPDARDVEWGGAEIVTSSTGIPHIAQVLGSAAEAETPIKIILSAGKTLYGRVLGVSAELACIEIWKYDKVRDEVDLPSRPHHAYIDIAAIDAVIQLQGEYHEAAQ